ncbi:hypothetical protein CMI37_08210 [Candidatus Pacearchaeota archaeon]|nr:hypothetical protein [Candidatus Pacearchaeota archaeon]
MGSHFAEADTADEKAIGHGSTRRRSVRYSNVRSAPDPKQDPQLLRVPLMARSSDLALQVDEQ